MYYQDGSCFQPVFALQFDLQWQAGSQAQFEGIYRCEGCAVCVVARKGDILPGSTHHKHEFTNAKITWRLIAATADPRPTDVKKPSLLDNNDDTKGENK